MEAYSLAELRSKSCKDLRDILSTAGLDRSGKKARLVERIREHQREDGPAADPAPAPSDNGPDQPSLEARLDHLQTLVESLVAKSSAQSFRSVQSYIAGLPAAQPGTAALPTAIPVSASASAVVDGSETLPTSVARRGVSRKVMESIRKGEYVEFDSLISDCTFSFSALSAEDEYALAHTKQTDGSAGLAIVKAKKAHTKVTDLQTWTMAWSIYAAILVEHDPSLAAPLLAYQCVIAEAAGTYRTSAWLAYDRAFRRMLATSENPDWSRIDPDLWQTRMVAGGVNAFCSSCNRRHARPNCTTQSTQPFRASAGPRPAENQHGQQPLAPGAFSQRRVCIDFNRQRCNRPVCVFAHKCSICRGDHTAQACPSRAPRATAVPGQ